MPYWDNYGVTKSQYDKGDFTKSTDRNVRNLATGKTGVSAAQLAAQNAAAKKKAEAKKKALEDAKHKTWLTDTKKKKKKKTDWVDKTLKTADTVDKLYKFGTTLNPLNLYKTNPYILGGTLLKSLYDKNKKTDANEISTTLNFKDPWKNKDLVYNETTGNFENKLTGEIVNQSLPGATQAKTFNTMKELMTIPGATQEKLWGSSHKLTDEGKNLGKFIESAKKLHKAKNNASTSGGTIENIKSWMTDDKRQNMYKEYLNESGTEFNETIKGALDKGLFEDKKDFTEQVNILEVKDGGPIRKKYYKGSNGILDLDETDGEEISLTAFNPKFDDVPELTEEKEEEKIDLFSETEEGDPLNELLLAEDGVTTLFRAKNGGTPQLAKKSKDGTRPGYRGSDWGGDDKDDFSGMDSGGWDPGVGSNYDAGMTSSYTGGGADQEDDVATMETNMGVTTDHSPDWSGPDRGWVVSEDEEKEYGGSDYASITQIHERAQRRKADYKNQQKKDLAIFGFTSLFTGINPFSLFNFGRKQEAKKNEYLETLTEDIQALKDKGVPTHHHTVDTLVQTLEQEYLDLTQPKKREWDNTPDGDAYPPVVPVHEEIQEYEQMAWDPMNYLDQIRSKQALRSSLQAKGIIQDNEVMLNSGGLANLFRVKNYN